MELLDADSTPSTDSTLVWAFPGDDQATLLMNAVAAFNDERDRDRPVRAFQMTVDRAT